VRNFDNIIAYIPTLEHVII